MFFFKKLFNSTVLGLTAGVLLAGYAVFAFQAPTQAPPAGNVPAPVNVGAGSQVKRGGLWVGSLGVDGGAILGGILNLQGNKITNVGAPTGTGDVTTKGYLDAAFAARGLVDADGDGFVAGVDCLDSNSTVFPGSASFSTSQVDVNCDTAVQDITTAVKSCPGGNRVKIPGADAACSTYCGLAGGKSSGAGTGGSGPEQCTSIEWGWYGFYSNYNFDTCLRVGEPGCGTGWDWSGGITCTCTTVYR